MLWLASLIQPLGVGGLVSRCPRSCCNLGIPPASALHSLCGAIASSDFMLSNLPDNSYSAENVNQLKLDRPKTCRFCSKTDSLPRRPGHKTLALESLARIVEGDAFFLLGEP